MTLDEFLSWQATWKLVVIVLFVGFAFALARM